MRGSSTIVHLDADAFFASVEQSMHPEYRGRPVITGKERGIVAAMSYEAKRAGITRGTSLYEVRRICPDAVILPSDYETYSLYSKRIFAVMRRYTPAVEEYSIDEAFADLSGLRRPLRMSYPDITAAMKRDIERELGITVSVGLAPSKVLAKVGSKWRKPAGMTHIRYMEIKRYLAQLPAGKVWGIGPNTSAYLAKCGVRTALQFAEKPEGWVLEHLTKPAHEVWRELNGESVYPVTDEEKTEYKSICKFKTFTPASSERESVLSQLSKNLENALIKARRYGLAAGRLLIILRTRDYRHLSIEAKLSRASAWPYEMMPLLEELFEKVWDPRLTYRSTGAVISALSPIGSLQMSLFDDGPHLERMIRVYDLMDHLAHRYGKHTLFLATSMQAQGKAHLYERGDVPASQELRKDQLCKRKFLDMPVFMGRVTD